jgi:hypothetical protein
MAALLLLWQAITAALQDAELYTVTLIAASGTAGAAALRAALFPGLLPEPAEVTDCCDLWWDSLGSEHDPTCPDQPEHT